MRPNVVWVDGANCCSVTTAPLDTRAPGLLCLRAFCPCQGFPVKRRLYTSLREAMGSQATNWSRRHMQAIRWMGGRRHSPELASPSGPNHSTRPNSRATTSARREEWFRSCRNTSGRQAVGHSGSNARTLRSPSRNVDTPVPSRAETRPPDCVLEKPRRGGRRHGRLDR